MDLIKVGIVEYTGVSERYEYFTLCMSVTYAMTPPLLCFVIHSRLQSRQFHLTEEQSLSWNWLSFIVISFHQSGLFHNSLICVVVCLFDLDLVMALQVDAAIDQCADLVNFRSVIAETKRKLESMQEDDLIEVHCYANYTVRIML